MNSSRESPETRDLGGVGQRIYRHRLPIRVTHWVNLVCMLVLLMSGLQIFNAHPALYWGSRSDLDQALVYMIGERTDTGALKGVTGVFDHRFDTTGVLGVSENSSGRTVARGFPSWATLPSAQWLAMGRQWHFFFAWLFVLNAAFYVVYSLCSRHLDRNLVPTGQDLRGIGRSIWDHLLFRHPKGEAAKRYNVLQRLTYLIVVFVLGPLVVLSGLTMSPWLDTTFPQLLAFFDGRQSARTIHFVIAFSFVAFTLIHIFEVLVTGVWNNLRSMVTGRYDIKGTTEQETS